MAQLVDSRGFQLAPDIAGGLLGGIQAGQQIRGQFTQQGETEAETARQNQFRQLSGIVADPSMPPEQRLAAQQQLAAVDPERQQKMIKERLSTMSAKETSYMKSVVMGAAKLNSIPSVEGKIQFLENRKAELIRDGITDHTDTDNVLNALKSGEEARAQEIIDKGIELGQLTGILQPEDLSGLTAGVKAEAKEKETEQKQVNVLRKGIQDLTKTFRTTEEATKRIRSVGKKGTASSDMALVFSFMKILDPGSTVREGEFATARDAAGVPQRVLNLYNNALEGTILGDTQRQDFLNQAESLFESQRASTDNQIENLLQQADQDAINRVRVFGKGRLSAFEKRQAGRKPAQALPQGVTEDDVAETMRANNMTREQVLQRLGAQ